MTALLLIHGVLLLFAVRRGWRAAPAFFVALPWVFLSLQSPLASLEFAGWLIPFANLLLGVGALSTLGLLYTAVVEAERI